MTEPARESTDRLPAALAALGSRVRIDLVRRLIAPRTLSAIDVHGEDGGSLLSRQAVRGHLDHLLEAGLVLARPSSRDGRSPVEYVVNHQAIYALSEEVRALAHLRPAVEPATDTVRVDASARPLEKGRSLVVVHGLDVGARFPLEPASGGPWLVGRRRDAAVALDFDPYVSAEHAVVRRDESAGALEIQDLPLSRNGTTLNFAPLPKGRAVPLRHGDLVGAGHTLLLYRDPS